LYHFARWTTPRSPHPPLSFSFIVLLSPAGQQLCAPIIAVLNLVSAIHFIRNPASGLAIPTTVHSLTREILISTVSSIDPALRHLDLTHFSLEDKAAQDLPDGKETNEP
jgi:hypothetical protein